MVAFAVVAVVSLAVLLSAWPAWGRLPFTYYTAASFAAGLVAALGYQLLE